VVGASARYLFLREQVSLVTVLVALVVLGCVTLTQRAR
jgi:hypothetical protein